MPDWILRPATPHDADALADCIRSAYAVYDGRIDDLPDVAGGIADDIRDHRVWVADASGRILGGAVLVLAERYAQLANIAVHPNAGGKGIGKGLIAAIEAQARAAGAGDLRLATHVGIPENVALYQRLGWRETGRAGNKVLMSKPL